MRTKHKLSSIGNLAVLFAIGVSSALAQPAGGSAKAWELRIYTTNAGKLADFQTLFRTQGLPLFSKYGMENVFDGTVFEGARIDGADAANMFVAVLAHANRAAADKAWASLEGDATWQAALKKSEQGGPLLAKPVVSIFMSSTEFSPALEAPTTGSATRVFELRKYNTGADALPRMVEEFKSGLAAILTKNGMTPIAYWTADDHSAFIYLLAHKDREAARASWGTFMTDFRPFTAEFNARVPAPPATGPRTPDDNRFLVPAEFSPRR